MKEKNPQGTSIFLMQWRMLLFGKMLLYLGSI